MRTETKILLALVLPGVIAATVFYLFILPPNVKQSAPLNGSIGVDLDASLTINFDKPVKRTQLEHSIEPNVSGEWAFENPILQNHLYRTLVFIPALPLQPDTQYKISLKNITGNLGIGMSGDFSYTFKTKNNLPKEISVTSEAAPNQLALASSVLSEPPMKILSVPMHWQERPLSCEAASLKMALNFKGIAISEDTIMKKIGFDLTPRKDNIWGDPNKSFVGNIDGSSCKTGYGVYWGPVAEAAKNWSNNAESFSNWSLQDLTREIRAGNPVIFWGTIPVKQLTDCSWYTAEGKYIKAFRETHVRVVIGYIGSAANPTKIVLNDALSGTLYWTTEKFMKNWKDFNYSGVVIR